MKRTEWNSLSHDAKVEFVEKKSVFIAQAGPVRGSEEASEFLSRVKAEYPDAGHHVYAWRAGENALLQKYSDDGEPSGTAGLPVLDALRKNDIDDAIIVVTRYFGGTLLGKGGLVRSYGRSALLALKEAVPVLYCICEVYNIMLSYTYLDKLLFSLERAGYLLESQEFGMDPVLRVGCRLGEGKTLCDFCTDLTSGQAIVEYIGKKTIQKERLGELRFES